MEPLVLFTDTLVVLFFLNKNLLCADGAQQLAAAEIKGGLAQEETLGRLAVTEPVGEGRVVITADPLPAESLCLRDPPPPEDETAN